MILSFIGLFIVVASLSYRNLRLARRVDRLEERMHFIELSRHLTVRC